MRRLLESVDCPECGSAGAVDDDFCQVCLHFLQDVVLGDQPPSAIAGH